MSARSPRTDSSRSGTTTPAPSPYRRALPAEAELPEDPLRLRLDFHEESTVLTDFPARGAARVRFVSALDVANALARELDLDTGLLPLDTLWWAKRSTGVRVAVWREPRVWTVRLRERPDAPPRRLRLPLPGLVFLCLPGGQAPYVFAAARRPHSLEDDLSRCPTYNTHDSGRVCTGSHAFPRNPSKVPEAFLQSFFSPSLGAGKSRRHPEDIGQLWAELRGQRAFPCEDLVPVLRPASRRAA